MNEVFDTRQVRHAFGRAAQGYEDASALQREIESRRVGGLGIELVRRICEKMTYAREGAFNRLVLHIRRFEAHDTQLIPML